VSPTAEPAVGRTPRPSAHDPARPVVLVTGASQGIGRATAELYAARGARLVLCARSVDALVEVGAVCEDLGAAVEVVATDVTDDAQVERAVAAALARFGRLDICVHVAGVSAYGHHTDTTADVFAHVISTNLVGAANVARSSLVVFRAQGAGTLVVVGSVLGRVAVPGMGAYVASKWGLRGLVRVLQQENRDLPGVRVTSVAPGSVRTSIYSSAVGGSEHGATPPPPSTSPRTVARAVRAAAARGSREHDVDAVGGLGNKVLAAAFTLAPGVFDRLIGPLVRTLSTTARPPAVGPGDQQDHR
jgi:NAD(P)-dependent dehydrogenase (short-subunit alcohol dehydrogenase family)